MARGINRVILVGNLGDDPETKYTQSGMAVTLIRLATTSVRKDRDGNTQERTEWHRVKFFGKLGEIAGEYLRKGSQCYVEGSIRYDKFTGQDGQEKYVTEILADEMQMLGGNREGGGGGQRQNQNENRGGGGQRQAGGQQGGGQRQSGGYQDRQGGGGGQQGGGYGGGGGSGGGRGPAQGRSNHQPLPGGGDDFADDDIPFATCNSMY